MARSPVTLTLTQEVALSGSELQRHEMTRGTRTWISPKPVANTRGRQSLMRRYDPQSRQRLR
jgi:hypothetical protein